MATSKAYPHRNSLCFPAPRISSGWRGPRWCRTSSQPSWTLHRLLHGRTSDWPEWFVWDVPCPEFRHTRSTARCRLLQLPDSVPPPRHCCCRSFREGRRLEAQEALALRGIHHERALELVEHLGKLAHVGRKETSRPQHPSRHSTYLRKTNPGALAERRRKLALG